MPTIESEPQTEGAPIETEKLAKPISEMSLDEVKAHLARLRGNRSVSASSKTPGRGHPGPKQVKVGGDF